jgi:CelD/BcsL family acetyltransferase involved in cellulose biosynthesis
MLTLEILRLTERISITIRDGTNGSIPDIRAEWDECLEQSPSAQAIFTYDWYAIWMRTYGSTHPWCGQTRILTAHTGTGRTVAVLPLAFRREKRLVFLCLAGFYQPLRSLVCIPEFAEESGQAFAHALLHRQRDWDVLHLGFFDTAAPERGAMLRHLQSAARNVVVVPRGRTIVNELRPSFGDYAKSKTVKRIATYEHRWRRQGEAVIKRFDNPAGDEVGGMLGDLRTIESNSWLARKGGDLRFATETDHRFWREVIQCSLSPCGQFQAWIAYLDGQPLAFRVSLRSGTTDYMIANQYDERFDKHRLGWILQLHHLRYACESDIRLIDSAPGDLHYKGRLGGREAEMRMDVFVFQRTVKGRLLSLCLGAAHRLRVALEKTTWGRRLAVHLPRI